MQIFVHTLDGGTRALDVEPRDTVLAVKRAVEAREHVPCDEQVLTYAGRSMDDDSSLEQLDVQAESTLFLSLRLLGGGKKRKKKNYTTPKKIKHKHKKVKLAVLKYYKVDENGKINRLRRECPGEACGAGVFMASMHDRQYCGKCYTTLVYRQPEDK